MFVADELGKSSSMVHVGTYIFTRQTWLHVDNIVTSAREEKQTDSSFMCTVGLMNVNMVSNRGDKGDNLLRSNETAVQTVLCEAVTHMLIYPIRRYVANSCVCFSDAAAHAKSSCEGKLDSKVCIPC